MAAYATTAEVQARMSETMDSGQLSICSNLLNDAAIIIDAYNASAETAVKNLVSIRMVIRAMNISEDIPTGATQGTMSALGYSQSWTMGTNASTGELYLNRLEKKLLGVGASIAASNPLSFITATEEEE